MREYPYRKFGRAIQVIRFLKGMTQMELAFHTGQDNSAIFTDGLTLNLKYSDEKKGWIHYENA